MNLRGNLTRMAAALAAGALLFCMAGPAALAAESCPSTENPITRCSAVADLADMKKYYEVPNFRIGGSYDIGNPGSFENGGKGGVTLESLWGKPLRVSYIDLGTPVRNADGEIVNAVIVSTYYSGDATNMYFSWYDGQPGTGFSKGAVIGPGKLIDTNKYYVVLLDALGLWGASKPSDGLGIKFPQYSYYDMVQANYRLLRDHLKVAKVRLATGVSMGATQTYVWGVMHPEFVDAIMPIGGTTASDEADPVVKWTFDLATAAIKGDPVWHETQGDYYSRPKSEHPNRGVEFSWSVLGLNAFDFDFRVTQSWDDVVKEVFYWEPEGEAGKTLTARAADFDGVDLVYRNECGNLHNINDHLGLMKSKVLIGHIINDNWLVFSKAQESAANIEGARLVGIESPVAHYAVFQYPNLAQADIVDFFREARIDTDVIPTVPRVGQAAAAGPAGGGKKSGFSK